MLAIGSLINGKYRIINQCGRGGMSIVYKAQEEGTKQLWAIKEIRKKSDIAVSGLIAETEMLKRLNHQRLPRIRDVIDHENEFLIVMDYIAGSTLKEILDEHGAQSQEKVIDWGKQLCDVLCYLHSGRPAIIYRDMKPSNIMLKPDGSIVLFDFGTAREYKKAGVEDTQYLGTQGYAAPEQYGGYGQTDARTDIYCLGATMYHLLTGHNPSMPPYTMYPIRRWNPLLSEGLENIILKCTKRNPQERFQTCEELMEALERCNETGCRKVVHQGLRQMRYRMFKAFRKDSMRTTPEEMNDETLSLEEKCVLKNIFVLEREIVLVHTEEEIS